MENMITKVLKSKAYTRTLSLVCAAAILVSSTSLAFAFSVQAFEDVSFKIEKTYDDATNSVTINLSAQELVENAKILSVKTPDGNVHVGANASAIVTANGEYDFLIQYEYSQLQEPPKTPSDNSAPVTPIVPDVTVPVVPDSVVVPTTPIVPDVSDSVAAATPESEKDAGILDALLPNVLAADGDSIDGAITEAGKNIELRSQVVTVSVSEIKSPKTLRAVPTANTTGYNLNTYFYGDNFSKKIEGYADSLRIDRCTSNIERVNYPGTMEWSFSDNDQIFKVSGGNPGNYIGIDMFAIDENNLYYEDGNVHEFVRVLPRPAFIEYNDQTFEVGKNAALEKKASPSLVDSANTAQSIIVPVQSAIADVAADGTVTPKAPGTIDVTINRAGALNYSASTKVIKLTVTGIEKLPLVIKVSDLVRTVNTENPVPTLSVLNNAQLKDNDTLETVLNGVIPVFYYGGAELNSAVGNYRMNVTNQNAFLSEKYNIVWIEGILSISTLKFVTGSYQYGDKLTVALPGIDTGTKYNNPTITIKDPHKASGVVATFVAPWSVEILGGDATAEAYNILAHAEPAVAGTHSAYDVEFTVNVTPRAGVIEYEPQSFTVGTAGTLVKTENTNTYDTNNSGTYTIPEVDNEFITVTADGTVTPKKVGVTPLTITRASDNNHTAAIKTIDITVLPKAKIPLTIKVVDQMRAVNTANPTPTLSVPNASQLTEGDTLESVLASFVPTFDYGMASQGAATGDYPITISNQNGFVHEKYTVSWLPGKLTVTRFPVLYCDYGDSYAGKISPPAKAELGIAIDSLSITSSTSNLGTMLCPYVTQSYPLPSTFTVSGGLPGDSITVTLKYRDRIQPGNQNGTSKSIGEVIVVRKRPAYIGYNHQAFIVGTTGTLVKTESTNTYDTNNSGTYAIPELDNEFVTVKADGTVTAKKAGTFSFEITRAGDNNHSAATKTITLDLTTLPVSDTDLIFTGTVGNNGWYTSDVTVTPSETAKTKGYDLVGINGNYNVPAIITTEGANQAIVLTLKNSQTGAVSAEITRSISIDKTAPTISNFTYQTSDIPLIYRTSPTITVQATDNVSKIISYTALRYNVNTNGEIANTNTPISSNTKTIALDTTNFGKYAVKLIAEDEAGNVCTPKDAGMFTFDNRNAVPVFVWATLPDNTPYGGNFTSKNITVHMKEANSSTPTAAFEYRQGASGDYTRIATSENLKEPTFVISSDMDTIYSFHTIATNGTQSNDVFFTIKLDSEAPNFTVAATVNGVPYVSGTVLKASPIVYTLTQNSSRLAPMTYSVKNKTSGVTTLLEGNVFTTPNIDNSIYTFLATSENGLTSTKGDFTAISTDGLGFDEITVSAVSNNKAYTGTWTSEPVIFSLRGGITEPVPFTTYQFVAINTGVAPGNAETWQDMSSTMTISMQMAKKIITSEWSMALERLPP